jgi:hypothetical protein
MIEFEITGHMKTRERGEGFDGGRAELELV